MRSYSIDFYRCTRVNVLVHYRFTNVLAYYHFFDCSYYRSINVLVHYRSVLSRPPTALIKCSQVQNALPGANQTPHKRPQSDTDWFQQRHVAKMSHKKTRWRYLLFLMARLLFLLAAQLADVVLEDVLLVAHLVDAAVALVLGILHREVAEWWPAQNTTG